MFDETEEHAVALARLLFHFVEDDGLVANKNEEEEEEEVLVDDEV